MALPKPSDTPRSKPNSTDEKNDSQFVGLESPQFEVFKTNLFKSLDTMIGRFTTLLAMKKTQDRLNEENALEASKPIPDKKLKNSVSGSSALSNALAFFAGALAVYMSDKIKEIMNGIYEWADRTFTNFVKPILNTLKVLPIIGPAFVAAHRIITSITNAKAHQFEKDDDQSKNYRYSDFGDDTLDILIEDGDPFDLDEDDRVLGTVLGDASDKIESIKINEDDIIKGLTENGLAKIFNKPDIDDTLDISKDYSDFGDLSSASAPAPAPAAPAPAPAAPAPAPAPAAPAPAPAPAAPAPAPAAPAPAPAPAAPAPAPAPAAPAPASRPEGGDDTRLGASEPPPAVSPPAPAVPPPAPRPEGGATGATPGGGGAGAPAAQPAMTATPPPAIAAEPRPPAALPGKDSPTDKGVPQQDTTRPSNVSLGSNADLTRVDKDLLSRFFGLAKEYGKPLTITSAFRSDAKQAELWARANIFKEPGILMPAKPINTHIITWQGRTVKVEGSGKGKGSSHGPDREVTALDVVGDGKRAANILSPGLLQKYGLHIPFKRDEVHIEKIGEYPTQSQSGGSVATTQPIPGQTPSPTPVVVYNQGTDQTNITPAPSYRPPAVSPALAARRVG